MKYVYQKKKKKLNFQIRNIRNGDFKKKKNEEYFQFKQHQL